MVSYSRILEKYAPLQLMTKVLILINQRLINLFKK